MSRLDPVVEELLNSLKSLGLPSLHQLTPEQAREGMKLIIPEVEPTPISAVVDTNIPVGDHRIPARIYRSNDDENAPVIVYYHGGGWVVCDLDTHDETCRKLALMTACVVISVGYRLAPEYKFPIPFDDAYAALCWVDDNSELLGVDASKIAVAGDSAGGNLAASVALKARDHQGPSIAHQSLWYPVTNVDSLETESYHLFAEGYRLERLGMKWFRDHYIRHESDAANPYVSPLLADDLTGLPDAYIMTAGFDVLRDEGRQYALALEQAGVNVVYECFTDQIHGFMGMTAMVPSADEAFERVAMSIKSALM